MALTYLPSIVMDELAWYIDAANPKSYPGTGTAVTDISGGGFNGTLTGGMTYSSASGGQFVFDGSTGYIDFLTQPDLNGSSYSVGCWFKTADQDMRLVQNCDSGSYGTKNGFQISVTATTFSNTAVTDTAGNYISFASVSSTPYTDANWHYICLVFDTVTGTASLYLDGESKDSQTDANLIGANMNGNLEIGRANSGIQYLSGSVSNAFMYTRALTATEVKRNYDALKWRYI